MIGKRCRGDCTLPEYLLGHCCRVTADSIRHRLTRGALVGGTRREHDSRGVVSSWMGLIQTNGR